MRSKGGTMACQPSKARARRGPRRHPGGRSCPISSRLHPGIPPTGLAGGGVPNADDARTPKEDGYISRRLEFAPYPCFVPGCRCNDTVGRAQLVGRLCRLVFVLAFLSASLMAASAWAKGD